MCFSNFLLSCLRYRHSSTDLEIAEKEFIEEEEEDCGGDAVYGLYGSLSLSYDKQSGMSRQTTCYLQIAYFLDCNDDRIGKKAGMNRFTGAGSIRQ